MATSAAADLSFWTDRVVTTADADGNPTAEGLYQGSLALFSEWREEVNSGERVAWVDCGATAWDANMAVTSVEDCMDTVRRSLGHATGAADAATLPASRAHRPVPPARRAASPLLAMPSNITGALPARMESKGAHPVNIVRQWLRQDARGLHA